MDIIILIVVAIISFFFGIAFGSITKELSMLKEQIRLSRKEGNEND